jgi:alpha-beta hydrolase superfamily lysophospholipase
METATLTDADGIEIFYRRWLPAADPRAMVLILHGASEHSARYARFGEALAAAGYAAYADDHRGFGNSAAQTGVGRPGPRGFDGVLDAIHAVQQQALADVGPVPVVLFGHSMGSVFAQVYAQQHATELAGFVLCGSFGPSPELAEMVAGIRAAVEAGAGETVLDSLGPFNAPFEPSRTPFDWLSRDEAEVDRYIADPMCGDGAPLTIDYAFGVLDLLSRGTDPTRIVSIGKDKPVLLITGEADPVSNGAETVRTLEALYREAGLAVTARYYPEARHELLNEINRDEVQGDVVSWITDTVPRI